MSKKAKSLKRGVIGVFALLVMLLLFSLATALIYISNFAKGQTDFIVDRIKLEFAGDSIFNFAIPFLKDKLEKNKDMLIKKWKLVFTGNKLFPYNDKTSIFCNYAITNKTSDKDKRYFISGIFDISADCVLKSKEKILVRSYKYHTIDILENIEISTAPVFEQFVRSNDLRNNKFILVNGYDGNFYERNGFLISKIREFGVPHFFSLDYKDLSEKDTIHISLKNILPNKSIKLNNEKINFTNFSLLAVFKPALQKNAKKEYLVFEVIGEDTRKNTTKYEFKLFFSDGIKQFFPQCSGYQVTVGRNWPFAGVRSCVLSSALKPTKTQGVRWYNFLIGIKQIDKEYMLASGESLKIPYNQVLKIWINGKKDYLSLVTPDYSMNDLSEYHLGRDMLEDNLVDNIGKKEFVLNNKNVKIYGLFVFEDKYTMNLVNEIKNKGIFENELSFKMGPFSKKTDRFLDIYVQVVSFQDKKYINYGLRGNDLEISSKEPLFEPIIIEKIEFVLLKSVDILN